MDTNRRLNNADGRKFLDYLQDNNVKTIVRYYASNSSNPKTITASEADFLIDNGFSLLPVFQDRNRLTSDFGAAKGQASAQKAKAFAERIGQPLGTTIFFAVDADFSQSSINSHIVPYFKAVKEEIGDDFKIGAYGSGAVMQTLMDQDLISVPWLSMSRLFTGTREFFYSDDWGLRQIPLPLTHSASGIAYDKNELRLSPEELGAFAVPSEDSDATGTDAHLGEGGASDGPTVSVRDGANAYVATEGLNFREEPNGTIIRALTIADPVVDLGAAAVSGWRNVEINGQRGVVFGKYLRSPVATEIETLLRATIDEWLRFGKGTLKETAYPQYEYIGEMWQALGYSYDGRDTDQYWSAAFISYVVRNAGTAYAQFLFSIRHSEFSNDAINARILDRTDRPFWGYRISEMRPKIGDIIHRNRSGNNFSFDYAENHSRFASHSDVVVEVTSHVVRVMGGNVANTVSMERFNSVGDDIQEYELDNDGFIAPGQKVIAVLSNRSDQVT